MNLPSTLRFLFDLLQHLTSTDSTDISAKKNIPPDYKRGGILNATMIAFLENHLIMILRVRIDKFLFVLYFQRRCFSIVVHLQPWNHTTRPSDHWSPISKWPGAFSVQEDHRIARFEEFLFRVDSESSFDVFWLKGTQQERDLNFSICTSFTLTPLTPFLAHSWLTSLV